MQCNDFHSESYYLFDTDVLRADNSVIDLSFKLNNSFDQVPRIEIVCCKALKILTY